MDKTVVVRPRMQEITALRGEHEKHFVVGYDGDDPIVEVHSAPVPIHYQKDGKWLDIAPVWAPTWYGYKLEGVPYSGRVIGRMVGSPDLMLLNHFGVPYVEDNRVWWSDIAPQTDAVLVASAYGLQLHLLLRGRYAPREWRFFSLPKHGHEVGGRDNVDRLTKRRGVEQNFVLDVESERNGLIVTKRWTGRVRALDPVTRRASWSDDVAYPVRVT
jgi:hypothetical protein